MKLNMLFHLLSIDDYISLATDYEKLIFKPSVLAFGRCMPGFLKLLLSVKLVCVSTPEGINNYSHEMDP